jgi:hypothetical protein
MPTTSPSLVPSVYAELTAIAYRRTPITLTVTSEPLPGGAYCGSLTGISRRPEPLTGVLIPTVDDRLLLRETHSGQYAFPLEAAHITAAHQGMSPDVRRRPQYTLDLNEGLGGSQARLTLTIG